jgi:hypothetical protein
MRSPAHDPPPPLPPPFGQQWSGLPPGCRNLWYSGYNAVSQQFGGQPIFVPTYNSQIGVQLRDFMGNDLFYGVPDHVVYDVDTTSLSLSTSSTLKYESDFKDEYGFDVSAEGSDDFFSVSGDTSFSYKGSLFSDKSKSYELGYFICRTGGFAVPGDPAPLDGLFAEAMKCVSALAPNDPKWTDFFKRFGTHYVIRCDLGGFSILQVTADNSIFETTSSADFHESFSMEFDDLISSGEMSASAYLKTSSLYKSNSESMRSFGTTKGGTPQSETKDFFVSCIYQPIVLTMDKPGVCRRPRLAPISRLFPKTAEARAQQALSLYSAGARQLHGVFPPQQPVIVNTLQTAAYDGILALSARTHNDAISLTTGTLWTSTTCIENTRTIWMPVNKGQSFIAGSSFPPSDARTATATLLPFQNPTSGGPVFGNSEFVDLEWTAGADAGVSTTSWVPPADGLLFISLFTNTATGNGVIPTLSVSVDGYQYGVTGQPGYGYYFYAWTAANGDRSLWAAVPAFGSGMGPSLAVTLTTTELQKLDGGVSCYFVPFKNLRFTQEVQSLGINTAFQIRQDSLILCYAGLGGAANGAEFTLLQGPTAAAATSPGSSRYVAATAMVNSAAQITLTTAPAATWIYPYINSDLFLGSVSVFPVVAREQ